MRLNYRAIVNRSKQIGSYNTYSKYFLIEVLEITS
jgi:hypothetical protein